MTRAPLDSLIDQQPRLRLANIFRLFPIVTQWDAMNDIAADTVVLRFTVLGRQETIRFTMNAMAQDNAEYITAEIRRVIDARYNAVHPFYRMAVQCTGRYANVDPWGRPA